MDCPVIVGTRTRLITYTLGVTCLILLSHRGKTDFLSMPIKWGSLGIVASSIKLLIPMLGTTEKCILYNLFLNKYKQCFVFVNKAKYAPSAPDSASIYLPYFISLYIPLLVSPSLFLDVCWIWKTLHVSEQKCNIAIAWHLQRPTYAPCNLCNTHVITISIILESYY